MASPAAPDHVCYVHCNFCNTILVVSVPGTNLLNIVTVRCGHCANLLPVNINGALPQTIPPPHPQKLQGHNVGQQGSHLECESSTRCNRISLFNSMVNNDQHDMNSTHPPDQKRQRVPSAYNRFIKEEIRRLKATNPDISHREAFSAAAKNWAHFPHIHLGLNRDGSKQAMKLDDGQRGQKSQGYH